MLKRFSSYDCIIIGSDVCGSLLAMTLADWGRRVALLRPSDRVDVPIPEAVLPATMNALLKRNGLMTSLRGRETKTIRNNMLIWADGEIQKIRLPQDEASLCINYRDFEDDLANMAKSMEADVFDDVNEMRPLPEKGQGTVRFVDRSGSDRELKAKTIVLTHAEERSRLVPLSLEHQLPSYESLTTIVEASSNIASMHAIEAVEEGWFEWIPLSNGLVALTLYCDPDEVSFQGGHEIFAKAQSQSSGPASRIEIGDLAGRVSTPQYCSTQSGVILAGPAVSKVDPLLNLGLNKALESAEDTARAVNTILDHNDWREDIVRYHQSVEERLYRRCIERSLHLYLEEPRFADKAFWAKRHESIQIDHRKIIIDVEDDEQDASSGALLPPSLVLKHKLIAKNSFRRRGRVYERFEGYQIPGCDEVQSNIAGVAICPLLKLVTRARETDRILQQAASDEQLYMFSQRRLLQALSELIRLDLIESA